MIRLIIFDWDGTIAIGAAEGYLNCYRETLKKLNLDFSGREAEIRNLITTGPTHIQELAILFKTKPELVDKARKIYEAELVSDSLLKYVRIIPGTGALLARLKEKYVLAVTTGTMHAVVEAVLKKFNLPNVFGQILTHHDLPDIKLAKPNAYMAEQILHRQNIRPEEAIVVGDGSWDVGMAVSAGIIPVAVLTGYLKAAEARNLGAKFVIPDVTHLEGVLNQLLTD